MLPVQSHLVRRSARRPSPCGQREHPDARDTAWAHHFALQHTKGGGAVALSPISTRATLCAASTGRALSLSRARPPGPTRSHRAPPFAPAHCTEARVRAIDSPAARAHSLRQCANSAELVPPLGETAQARGAVCDEMQPEQGTRRRHSVSAQITHRAPSLTALLVQRNLWRAHATHLRTAGPSRRRSEDTPRPATGGCHG